MVFVWHFTLRLNVPCQDIFSLRSWLARIFFGHFGLHVHFVVVVVFPPPFSTVIILFRIPFFLNLSNRCPLLFIKKLFRRVINLLLTSLARNSILGISALHLFCTDLAQDLGPIISQYGPHARLITCIYTAK